MTIYRLRWGVIEQVEVDRVTEKCVWIAGRKHSLVADWESFHLTYAAAKGHAVMRAQEKCDLAQRRLTEAQENLQEANAL